MACLRSAADCFRRVKVLPFQKTLFCCISSYKDTFKFSDLKITLAEPSQRRRKPDPNNLIFGKEFSDHMFQVAWSHDTGWGQPEICPLHNFNLHPASKVFHYAQELFEGLKAFRCKGNQVMLFRPQMNVERMLRSAERAALPAFDGKEFLSCLKKLVDIEKDWTPDKESCTLYIRPTFIGTEPALGVNTSSEALLYVICGPVGPYFATGVRKPVSLYADPKYVRAWHGGIGDKKMGANYAPTIYVQKQAEKQGLQQVLWLYGNDHQLTEVGTMNIFVYLMNKDGEKELITPPLDGIILPGVVRQSLLDLAYGWKEFIVSERTITMKEVINAIKDKKLLEIFGCGTACNVCPVSSITYMGQKFEIPTPPSHIALNERFFQALSDIQSGKVTSEWMVSLN